jgi:hypothetical protein
MQVGLLCEGTLLKSTTQSVQLNHYIHLHPIRLTICALHLVLLRRGGLACPTLLLSLLLLMIPTLPFLLLSAPATKCRLYIL